MGNFKFTEVGKKKDVVYPQSKIPKKEEVKEIEGESGAPSEDGEE